MTSAVFHTGPAPSAWRGSLFLAIPDQECIVRVSGFDRWPARPAVERLFPGVPGRIVALLSATDGLFFATDDGARDEAGGPTGAVYRVRAQ